MSDKEVWEQPPWPHDRESWEEVKALFAKYGLDARELWTRNAAKEIEE
jgi:hypothetical protein